jgi:hypothetical protein
MKESEIFFLEETMQPYSTAVINLKRLSKKIKIFSMKSMFSEIPWDSNKKTAKAVFFVALTPDLTPLGESNIPPPNLPLLGGGTKPTLALP